MATAAQQDFSGTREHLTASQTRTLYRLWQRFFRLCETPADYTHNSNGRKGSGDGRRAGQSSSSAAVATTAGSGSGNGAQQPTSASSSGEKLAGPSTLASGDGAPETNADGTSRHQRVPSTAYGKPLQRQPSNIRAIDERGNHIPRDDRVKDELKTLEEAKEMREFLERYGGARLREIFWDMVKGEHPDAVMLRFLRARKWNVDRAIAVIGSTAAFRADNDVANILKGGELGLTSTKGGMNILTNGVSYIYGATHAGEPVEFIEVGRHFSHNQTQDELKRGVILLQEHLQILMPPPIERKVIVFNMNDFGIRNMDWWCVFFMVKTMESYYVETLARVYVHGAPWIFKPIWAILKPLLDPVVRDKVRLTDRPEELAEHIPFNHLPKGTMRGGLDWEFEFPKPESRENDIQKDTATRDKLLQEYRAVGRDFERATQEVAQVYARQSLMRHQTARAGGRASKRGALGLGDALSSDDDDDDLLPNGNRRGSLVPADLSATSEARNASETDVVASLKARRDVLATKLRVAFLKLRPYIVGKMMVDRWNVAREDGSMHWRYPTIDGEVEEQTLGMGTTLHELERNLSILEEAHRQAAGASGPASTVTEQDSANAGTNGLPKHLRQASGPSTKGALQRETGGEPAWTGGPGATSAGLASTPRPSTDLTRRQQRLKSRPAVAGPTAEETLTGQGQQEAGTAAAAPAAATAGTMTGVDGSVPAASAPPRPHVPIHPLAAGGPSSTQTSTAADPPPPPPTSGA